MRGSLSRHACIAAVIATLGGGLGCGSSSDGPEGPMAGHWVGSTTSVGLDMTLTDHAGQIGGSGTIGGSAITGGEIPFNVSGSRNSDSTFALTLKATGFTPATYAGKLLNDTTAAGTLNGSGFGTYILTTHRR